MDNAHEVVGCGAFDGDVGIDRDRGEVVDAQGERHAADIAGAWGFCRGEAHRVGVCL